MAVIDRLKGKEKKKPGMVTVMDPKTRITGTGRTQYDAERDYERKSGKRVNRSTIRISYS